MEKEKKHVVPMNGKWAVKNQNSEKATRVFGTKEQAVDYAEELASKKDGCVVVHNNKGRFERIDCEVISPIGLLDQFSMFK